MRKDLFEKNVKCGNYDYGPFFCSSRNKYVYLAAVKDHLFSVTQFSFDFPSVSFSLIQWGFLLFWSKSPVGWFSYLWSKRFNYGHKAFPNCILSDFLSSYSVSISRLRRLCFALPAVTFTCHTHLFPLPPLAYYAFTFFLFSFSSSLFSTFPLWFFFFLVVVVPFKKIALLLRRSAKIPPEADRHKVLMAKVNIQIIWRAG